MGRLLSLLLLLAMLLHLFRPLGLPGLRKRGDAWKIALVAFFVFGLTVLVGSH